MVEPASGWLGGSSDFLIKAGGVFGIDGKPLMGFDGLRNIQKGVVGEVLGGDVPPL